MSPDGGRLEDAQLSVIRTDLDTGATTSLPSIRTGADGVFALTDVLPRNLTKAQRVYEYSVSYAGSPKSLPSFNSRQVLVGTRRR